MSNKKRTPSKRTASPRRLSVRGTLRREPDLNRIARSLAALAIAQAEKEAEAERQREEPPRD
ncbi:hypothetical protein [Curtobacterium sp. MCBD17_019]|uniref:hypothetical protein n=1 Tax=Curtobacterium sp. MCBD17_019 TaxID=2175669 RepID=UPI0011B747D0|nr:hypothetical protein [Curtobacterium sp. MCBD17_019]